MGAQFNIKDAAMVRLATGQRITGAIKAAIERELTFLVRTDLVLA